MYLNFIGSNIYSPFFYHQLLTSNIYSQKKKRKILLRFRTEKNILKRWKSSLKRANIQLSWNTEKSAKNHAGIFELFFVTAYSRVFMQDLLYFNPRSCGHIGMVVAWHSESPGFESHLVMIIITKSYYVMFKSIALCNLLSFMADIEI